MPISFSNSYNKDVVWGDQSMTERFNSLTSDFWNYTDTELFMQSSLLFVVLLWDIDAATMCTASSETVLYSHNHQGKTIFTMISGWHARKFLLIWKESANVQ